jgi:hypothetical protein
MEETTSKGYPTCADCRRAFNDMGDVVRTRDFDRIFATDTHILRDGMPLCETYWSREVTHEKV